MSAERGIDNASCEFFIAHYISEVFNVNLSKILQCMSLTPRRATSLTVQLLMLIKECACTCTVTIFRMLMERT